MTDKKRRKKRWILFGLLLILLAAAAAAVLSWFHILPHRAYTEEDFGIERVLSAYDYNKNGVDDYTDILLGARQDAENHPAYRSAYYAGGYPPEDEGVCTDLVWRAFQNAGYSLKDMVDADIRENTKQYPRVEGKPDPNIDFRRVKNLKVFFDRYALNLTTDPYEIAEWQPGDIVIFGTDHIGIISDKRNAQGIPFLIHNGGQPEREEDALLQQNFFHPISGHYRFQGDAAYKEIFRVVKKD